ncbi:MAG TPA: TonB family protein [Pelobium sp.]|nr:TonB family protein [Pelobium sp.]
MALASGLIPLMKTNWFNETAKPVQQRFIQATVMVMDGYASPVEETWTLGDILTLVYFGVILLMSIRLIYKLIKLNRILKDKDQPEAFSFFRKIRINKNLPEQTTIEKHELTHAKQLHSADVLLFEVLSIINWFNPVIYCYKNSIKHIHEFIADEAVLKKETDKSSYAILLLSKTFGINPNTLTNNFFNQSLLKRRIEMMNKTKSRKTAIIKYGLSAPLFLLAMVLSSAKISESKTINNLSEKVQPEKQLSEILVPAVVSNFIAPKSPIISNKRPNQIKNLVGNTQVPSPTETRSMKTDSVVKPDSNPTAIYEVSVIGYRSNNDTTTNNKVFTNVEVLPSFPGGIQAFRKFLAENLRYPKVAHDANIQGRVFCQFVVEKDGSLSNIKVVRGIGGGCDEEAVRVLAISPKWNPGMQNGRIVRVSYTIPIFFQLKEEKVERSFSSVEIKNNNQEPFKIVEGETGKTTVSNSFGIKYYNGTDEELPLLYLDGKKISNTELKSMDKEIIESINVLKGESATKKYGDKGKLGVIEITTKKK